MAADFLGIQEEAQRRWERLTAGDRPWIRVGTALCGQAAGADQVVESFNSELEAQGVSAQVSRVGCLGLCFAEPMVDVQVPGQGRVVYGNVGPDDVKEIVSRHLNQGEVIADLVVGLIGEVNKCDLPSLDQHPMKAREQRIALRNAGHVDPMDIYQYVANGGYGALNRALTDMTAAEVLEEVNTSGLRGRGGAAFPAGTKWRFLAGSNAPDKYILCNCEEGDPGAFNDKGILESDPHTVVEGIILAGYATGANHGYIFIRPWP